MPDISYKGWTFEEEVYDDDDRFPRYWRYAMNDVGGTKHIDVSDFTFDMTQARFEWFVDNGFPNRDVFGQITPFSSEFVDEQIAAHAKKYAKEGS